MRTAILLASIVAPSVLAQDTNVFSVPGQDWGIRFQSPLVTAHKGVSNGSEFQLQIETRGGLYVSVFVEPAEGKGNSSGECKDFYWTLMQKNTRIDPTSIESKTSGEFSMVSYIVRAEADGKSIVQPNVNYYAHRNGKCIDVHVSQPFLKGDPIDRTNLELFERTLEFVSVP